LAVADVHWLSLNPKLEGLIVPSKFYGIAAAGKPTIIIGDKNGEIARLVQRRGCGLSSRRAMPMHWLNDGCRMSHKRFRKWAGGREQCLMRILRGRTRWSNGADCSISSMNGAEPEWQMLSSTIKFR
jgi:hypothetical protein